MPSCQRHCLHLKTEIMEEPPLPWGSQPAYRDLQSQDQPSKGPGPGFAEEKTKVKVC